MGSGLSQEHLEAYLQRQESLIKQLQSAVDRQADSLTAMGIRVIDYSVNGLGDELPLPHLLSEDLAYLRRSTAVSNRRVEPPVTEDEDELPPTEWAEPTPEEEQELRHTKPWLAQMAPPTGFAYDGDAARRDPPVSLQLEHVYGYRPGLMRHSVIWIDANTLLYTAATVGVVHNIKTNTQLHFLGHTNAIVSLGYHRERRIAVTGEQGKVPSIYVWSVDDGTELAKIAGFHSRAVTTVAFSRDGSKIVATGLDDRNSITVYDWATSGLLATATSDSAAIFDAAFNATLGADANAEFVTCGPAHVTFWRFDSHNPQSMRSEMGLLGNLGRKQAILALDFTGAHTLGATQSGEVYVFSGRRLVRVVSLHDGCIFALLVRGGTVFTGGEDGVICRTDAVNFTAIGAPLTSGDLTNGGGQPHAKGIRALDLFGDDLVIGTQAGAIYKATLPWSAAPPRVLISAHAGDSDGNPGELWALTASPNTQRFATAGDDSTLRIWDADTRESLHTVRLPGKGQCVAWSPDGAWIAVGLQSGFIAFVNAENGEVMHVTTTSRRRIQCIKFSPSGDMVAAGSADCVVYLFNGAKGRFNYIGKLGGHTSVVLKVDFSEDEKYIQTCNQSYELIFYDVQRMELCEKPRDLRDVKWASYTSILGWDVQGIWPQNSDGSEVNAVCRSHSGTLLASAENTGLVKVFSFPCVGGGLDRQAVLNKRPHSLRVPGHGSCVTEVSWTAADERLLSVGGPDLCVLQWKVVPNQHNHGP